MSETQNTPGPWHVSESGLTTNDGQIAVLAGDDRICLVDAPEAIGTKQKDRWRIESPVREANACLIAAAPELLDCLKEFVAAAERSGIQHDALRNRYERAVAAISRATGEPS